MFSILAPFPLLTSSFFSSPLFSLLTRDITFALGIKTCVLRSYHEWVSVGRQQSRPVPAAQSAHCAVVRVRGPDEVVHVTVPAAHPRRRSHRVTPQYVDGIVQTLQTVLNTTLLQNGKDAGRKR